MAYLLSRDKYDDFYLKRGWISAGGTEGAVAGSNSFTSVSPGRKASRGIAESARSKSIPATDYSCGNPGEMQKQTKFERVSCDEPTGGHARFIVIMFAGEALEGAGDRSTNSAGAAIFSHAGRALPVPSRTDRAKSLCATERHASTAAQRSADAF